MSVKSILSRGKIYILVLFVLISSSLFILIHFTFLGTALFSLISFITHPFLISIESFANHIFRWIGSPISFQNHTIIHNGTIISGFTSQIMYKKITIFYIIMVWLTHTSNLKRISFTALFLILGFLSSTAYLITGAYYFVNITNHSNLFSVINSVVFCLLNTIFLLWYWLNKKSSLTNNTNVSGIRNMLERKLLDIIVLIFVYTILLFSLGYFDFSLMIEVILKSSSVILGIFGYHTSIESNVLTGIHGSISVYRTCLGIMMMFLFASLVYLTGNDRKRSWRYILFGLAVLFASNILRIVLLFVYIQHFGTELALDVHDLFNYITYAIVFILWVIWFERYMDLKTMKRTGKPGKETLPDIT
jgi:exosortase/archaeosortase family protein